MAAQLNMGISYITGAGVEQDDEKAAMWFFKAASQGSGTAQYNLGLCYETGRGVEQDIDEAVEWYERAAEQGSRSAQTALERLDFDYTDSED